MERNKAMVAAAATSVMGLASAVGLAAYTGSGLLGFGAAAAQGDPALTVQLENAVATVTTTTDATQIVTQYQDQYDRYVVNVPQSAPEAPAPVDDAPPPASTASTAASPSKPTPTTSASTQSSSPDDSQSERDDEGEHDDHEATSSDAPQMPPGCVDGQLEDDGVWNCQH